MTARNVRRASLTHLQVQPFDYAQDKQSQDDTLSLDNGGASGPDYFPSAGSGFRRATPGPIQHQRWYRARSL
jgi:hypothetical protein